MELQQNSSYMITVSKSVVVSHLVASLSPNNAIGQVVSAMLDGGTIVRSDFVHALRVPKYMTANEVVVSLANLDKLWNDCKDRFGNDEWVFFNLKKLREIYMHSAAADECIISFLSPPGRARIQMKLTTL